MITLRYHLLTSSPADARIMQIAYMLTSLGKDGAERQVRALADLMAAQGTRLFSSFLNRARRMNGPSRLKRSGLACADRS